MLPKNFQYCNNNHHVNLYNFRRKDTGYTREQLIQSFKVYTEFMQYFNCSIEEFCEILDLHGIPDNKLFEYDINNSGVLLWEKYIYDTRYNSYGIPFFVYHNIYIKCNHLSSSLILNDIATELVKRRFPFLFEGPFVKTKKRFTDDIINLPKTVNAKVSDIDALLMFNNNLTIEDLIKLYTDETYKDSLTEDYLCKVYQDGSIYIKIEEHGWSINLNYEILAKKDWKAIEEKNVSSIPLRDENGNYIKRWYSGPQVKAPYFNSEIVQEFKKYFI